LAIIVVGAVLTACSPPQNEQPTCRSAPPTLLMAESVPTASLIPCVDALPQGWTWHSFEADETSATFSLEQQDGDGTLEVQLLGSCTVSGDGSPVDGFPDATRYGSPVGQGASVTWTTTFPGGCSRASVTFSAPPPQSEIDRLERSISLLPRDQLRPE
jgi:hypothetical protein